MQAIYVLVLLSLLGFESQVSVDAQKPPSSKIVGGSTAELGTWPWQGMLLRASGGSLFLTCGCTLIQSRWVMTAAHCTVGVPAERIFVRFGSVNKLKAEPSSRDYAIEKVIQYPDYDAVSYEGDISVMKISGGPVEFTQYIQPALLPQQGVDVNVDADCWVTGWGTLEEGNEDLAPVVLQEVGLPIVDQETCQRWYTGRLEVQPSQVCAGYAEGGKDTCQGDSGGPLSCMDPGSDAFLVQGITSFGLGCARKLTPGIYTRVSEYAEWIHNTTGSRAHGLITTTVSEYADWIHNTTGGASPLTRSLTLISICLSFFFYTIS